MPKGWNPMNDTDFVVTRNFYPASPPCRVGLGRGVRATTSERRANENDQPGSGPAPTWAQTNPDPDPSWLPAVRTGIHGFSAKSTGKIGNNPEKI